MKLYQNLQNSRVEKKYEYLHERVKVLVLCDETCTLKEIQIQERNRLETELNSRVHGLYVEIVHLQNKINKVENEKQEIKRMLSDYTEVNKELNSHIEFLTGRFINRGKKIGECKRNQATKKKFTFKRKSGKKSLVCQVVWG